MTHAQPKILPLTSSNATGLKGRIKVPGDKSMSHRALMFGAIAIGETTIKGLLEAEDVVNTAKAMAALGARTTRDAAGICMWAGWVWQASNRPQNPLILATPAPVSGWPWG